MSAQKGSIEKLRRLLKTPWFVLRSIVNGKKMPKAIIDAALEDLKQARIFVDEEEIKGRLQRPCMIFEKLSNGEDILPSDAEVALADLERVVNILIKVKKGIDSSEA